MLFTVHDDDGRITMSNKVYDHVGYDKRLREHGFDKFVAVEHPGLRSPDHWYVRDGQHAKRPKMRVMVDKKRIKAGERDAAIFRGIPKGARLIVVGAGAPLHDIIMEDGELELHIPLPCTYRVSFEKWPYRSVFFDIEAIA